MEQVKQETIKMEEMRKQLSKSEVIGSFVGMGYKKSKESRNW